MGLTARRFVAGADVRMIRLVIDHHLVVGKISLLQVAGSPLPVHAGPPGLHRLHQPAEVADRAIFAYPTARPAHPFSLITIKTVPTTTVRPIVRGAWFVIFRATRRGDKDSVTGRLRAENLTKKSPADMTIL